MNIAKDLYNYRELLKTNIKKDVGGKYKNSVLELKSMKIIRIYTSRIYKIQRTKKDLDFTKTIPS